MKPFNLEAALAGEPVQLRTGQKAVILYYIPKVYKYESGNSVSHPLRGIIFNKQGKIITANEGLTEYGTIALNHEHNFDIIGMWEEPIKFEDLPKPFIPKKGEEYFSVSPHYGIPEVLYANSLNHPSILNGNCFRTEEDAQMWIDFMKSMQE